MISKKQLEEANKLIAKRDRIRSILHGMGSPHVRETVGLVAINAATTYRTGASEHADFFHNNLKDIQEALEFTLGDFLTAELDRTKEAISKILHDA